MKKTLLTLLAMAFLLLSLSGSALAATAAGQVEISFTYQRLAGPASNQYAIWIEDEAGNYVRTLYATQFTADGGWERRPLSLARWVKVSALPEMTPAAVDAISGATPRPGKQTYVWDCKNDAGDGVPAGKYVVCIEGTLRNEDVVIYTALVEIGGPSAEFPVQTEYLGKETEDRSMLGDVQIHYVAP